MNRLFKSIFISLLTAILIPQTLSAQSNIPIVGADESLSQYICVTIPGVKTYGMKVISSNGTVSSISVKAAKAQVDKQIQGLTKKILNASDLLKAATKKKQKDKLKAKIQALRSQRETARYIKTQISLCEKAKLEFSVATVPVLLTNTVSNPTFPHPLNHFMFGFKFTIPANYKGKDYCVAVSNATSTPNNIGGIIYPETGFRQTEVYRNCQNFGDPVGQLCVNGLEADEGMILITQGAFEETVGDCTFRLFNCSLNNFRNLLSSHYVNTRLTSFSPGGCN